MKFKLDRESRELLRNAGDDVFVGVVREKSSTLVLYRAGWQASLTARVVPGHQQLLELGQITVSGHMGFSFHVKDGKLRAFYRNLILNRRKSQNCISEQEMDGIIETLGLGRADNFRSYP